MTVRSFPFTALIAFASTACALPQRNVRISPHEVKKDSVGAFSTPADLRLTFVRPRDDGTVFCAEPMPDVSLGSSAEISGSGKGSSSGEANLSSAYASSLNSSYASTLKELNEAIRRENVSLRRELEKAVKEYERETGEEYKVSVDSALSTSSESSLSTSSESGSKFGSAVELQAAAKFAATVSELQGRTQQVLLAREFLYRLCEARANGFFDSKKSYINMQENALRMIESISKPPQKSATEVQADLLKQTTELYKAQVGTCDGIKKSCEAATAAGTAAEKAKCPVAHQTCLEKLAAPTQKDARESASSLGSITSSALTPSADLQAEVAAPSGP